MSKLIRNGILLLSVLSLIMAPTLSHARKKRGDGYPECLSTHGGPGCQGKVPDPKLPPKDHPPIQLRADGSKK